MTKQERADFQVLKWVSHRVKEIDPKMRDLRNILAMDLEMGPFNAEDVKVEMGYEHYPGQVKGAQIVKEFLVENDIPEIVYFDFDTGQINLEESSEEDNEFNNIHEVNVWKVYLGEELYKLL